VNVSTLQLYLEYFARAEEFLQAYRDLPKDNAPPPNWPRYFLFCQSIELVLKAYLAWQGVNANTLKRFPFGHSLKALMAEAVSRGLAIGSLARGEIELLDDAHAKHWPRYPEPGPGGNPVFVIDPFEPYVKELFEAVRDALFRSNAIP